ncbi:amyloid beta A4 precursor protein-binding family B member 1-interacting protein [Varanus komodoensis]|uniref:Amyloid beta A4 precursor protein-binding family B member 1-interacting protein n=1 Tax=Varanus komodoensis TaxID=61221 RepID=A0A8D2LW26_VARKO|nr:amyloid beta A4 precursor protein-binding family B member 1-interacting protein [Varanus komodoensis]XP_044280692.1 amyloid beta A4 precursor protein-binding family B member 1-interacting protein [Varanus komodoensis]
MEEACEDIDQMFSDLLGEMDLLTQSLGVETLPPPPTKASSDEFNFAVGFKDLNESLNALEDTDLDALMADLVADISEVERSTLQEPKDASRYQQVGTMQPSADAGASYGCRTDLSNIANAHVDSGLPPPSVELDFDLPPPPPSTPPAPPSELLTKEEQETQAKADKIKLALEKLKEAKVKKLVIKVHMNDNSTKSLMVDERQVARDVLDNLFEKTHCDCNIDWCLYEMCPELQIERFFEDHENVIGVLSDWTRDSENKLLFLEKSEKYAVFKNPQNFYLSNKGKNEIKVMNEKSKESLLEESFCGTSVIVPEVEGALYLKEDGKKSWKKRYFLLRASGIYYVPKGKTKTSRDLACFIQFENVNVYYGIQYKMKYKAPTDHCFVLKHPQIQRESQYIKYLCCEDQQALHHWVTGIRIAKYGKTLYDNYIRAAHKAGLASRLAKSGNTESIVAVGTSAKGSTHANGQVPQSITLSKTDSSETGKSAEMPKVKKPDNTADSIQAPTPNTPQLKHQRKAGGSHSAPPMPPQRVSSAVTAPLQLPTNAEGKGKVCPSDAAEFPPPPESMLPPPELEDLPLPPPPPPEYFESPPDFIPPPPPSCAVAVSAGAPPLPPPPPSASLPRMPLSIKKKPPPPPRRQEESAGQAGLPKPSAPPPKTETAGQGDFMSDLMKALEKKRGATS